MKNERQIAELIFDKFRTSNCKAGHIVMMKSIRFGVIDKLNPKEQENFYTVVNGLIFTGYFTYEEDSPESIRLTEKGYDYIYDEQRVEVIQKLPWIFPDIVKPDWDRAYYKLWRIIGPQDSASHYMGGSQFYKFIMDLADDIPPSYGKYIEERKKNDLSTTRVDYYQDLINHLNEEKRKILFAKIQIYIEESLSKDFQSTQGLGGINHFKPKANDIIPKFESVPLDGADELANMQTENAPIVFISYSWDSLEHEEWVLNLATSLREHGVDVILDKWDLGSLGKPLPHFMEDSVKRAKRVICVMTPNYKIKTDKLSGGVGFEYSIISAEIFSDIQTSKFIPLFRRGSDAEAIPTSLRGRKYTDMREDNLFNEKLQDELLRDIFEVPKFKKPPLGKKPKFE